MALEQGKTYEFDVLDIVENSVGNKRLLLRYGDRSTYKCNIFPFQEDDIPNMVWCKVIKLDPCNGFPILVQDKAKFLHDNYIEGESYPFLITKISTDKNEQPYYELNDRWGFVHFGYFQGAPEYKENEEHLFEVYKIDTEKARLKLKIVVDKKTTNIQNNGVFGCEGQDVEFKTSIVFTPGNSQPNIDEQLSKNIVKEIAGFLNADGGTLYIGVNDKGYPVGMADDYAHLNDTNLTPDDPYYDRFVGNYGPTTDKYELKIRHAVARILSQRALENLQFEFPEKYAGKVCIIHIKPLKRPVFFCGNRLYVRTGNQTPQYKNDAIISFIQDRLELQIHDVLDSEQLGLLGKNNITIDDIKKIVRELFIDHPVATPATSAPTITIPIPTVTTAPKDDEVWNYFTYYKSGEYSIQKDPMTEEDIVAQVCVHKREKDQRILLCYNNGCVASVVPSKIYDSRYRGKRRPKGWNIDAKLMNVFVANTYDMLGAISVDANQGRWVKVHNVSDLGTPKQSMNSKGNTIISPKLGTVSEYKFIPASHRNIIPNLIFQKAETSRSLGVPETMQQYLNEVTYFKKI